MNRLLVLKAQRTEDARSPEFRYLYSFCLAQAREVFDEVAAREWNPSPPAPATLPEIPPSSSADAVLLLGTDNTLLGAAALRAMWRQIEEGADMVLPSPLHHHPAAGGEEIFTLRGFERVEEIILQTAEEPRQPAISHLPIALVSPDQFADLTRRFDLPTLLSDKSLLERLEEPRPRVCGRGVYHLFVDYYGQLRDDLLPYLPTAATDVLEIGCARGLTGAWIQEQLHCRVTGVELNPEAAAEARTRLHDVIVGDIESVEIHGRFDAVVATELFEHLNYPELFLEKMKPLLKPGGRILLSVPNVGHYSVVEDLLAGRWDYLPIGLLCYTHFRFFTRPTLEDWIRRVGIEKYEIIAQTTPLPDRFIPLAGTFETDVESLRTKGFYVILKP